MERARDTAEMVQPNRAVRLGQGPWGRALRWLRLLPCPWRARPRRQLRLCESLALGERRFLSLVELGEQRFLVGGTGTSLALLAVLSDSPQLERKRLPQEDDVAWRFVNGELTQKPGCGSQESQ